MIPALAYLAAALWLAQILLCAHIARTRSAPAFPPPPPVEPTPPVEPVVPLGVLIRLDAYDADDLRALHRSHPHLSPGEILIRCLRVQARAERGG